MSPTHWGIPESKYALWHNTTTRHSQSFHFPGNSQKTLLWTKSLILHRWPTRAICRNTFFLPCRWRKNVLRHYPRSMCVPSLILSVTPELAAQYFLCLPRTPAVLDLRDPQPPFGYLLTLSGWSFFMAQSSLQRLISLTVKSATASLLYPPNDCMPSLKTGVSHSQVTGRLWAALPREKPTTTQAKVVALALTSNSTYLEGRQIYAYAHIPINLLFLTALILP